MQRSDFFGHQLKVINIGLESFKIALDETGATSVQVDWRPPVEVDPGSRERIRKALPLVEEANARAMDIILRGRPHLTGLARALDAIPGMNDDMILHAGPPITWERMCGPMKGAMIAALMYEGRARGRKDAERLAASGRIEFSPCHEHGAVGPMAGIISPSMPVFLVRNEEFENTAYCTMNEGLGKVLRYGAYSHEVIDKLKWMEGVLYPVMKKALDHLGSVDLKGLIAQALHMGDEVHNRNRAATSLFYRLAAPAIVRTSGDSGAAASVLDFINGNDHFFLNLSMPACKATLDPARNIENSSIVVAMSRNGTDFGIQVSGTGDRWFTGPADVPDALFFPGFSREDANPDIGDSSITETNGLGGFAIAASPAIVQFVGGSTEDAIHYTLRMYEITSAEHSTYQIPYLDFRGTPVGIDVIKVIERNILPFIDTGVAHREPGVGQVGAGVLSAPLGPFRSGFEGLAERMKN
jgi:hypothetical protein